jgi:outer membrane protein
MLLGFLLASLVAGPAVAQTPLALADVVARVRQQHPGIRAAATRVREAEAQVDEARAAWWPRVEASEGWQRGDLPVMAFSARLSQRQFSAADFEVSRLNHPDVFDNFRSTVSVDQPIFDGTIAAAVQAAGRGRDVADAARDRIASDAVLDAVETFGRVHLYDAMSRAAQAAVAATQADVDRASNRQSAGLATDADVLSLSAELQMAKSRLLDAQTEAGLARSRLAYLMGEPAGRPLVLVPLALPPAPAPEAAEDARALARRPDLRLARAFERAAGAEVSRAQALRLPRALFRASTEWNGPSFGSRAQAWMLGVEVRWTVFQGRADRARLVAARASQDARAIDRAAAESRAELEIGAGRARVATAAARIELARAALAAAREGQRIVRDRYDHGLADATALLAAGRAVLDAEAAAVAADVTLVLERARLDAALGVL